MILILITITLLTTFIVNFFVYWIIFFKTEKKISKGWDNYSKLYFIIWAGTIIAIPIITSSIFGFLFGTVSYFREFWIWFIVLGIVIIILALKFGISAMKINKMKGLAKGKHRLITDGPYEVQRHPMYTSWALIFLGLALIFDSLIALIITPFLMLFLGLLGFLEEKYLLIPQFGNEYAKYKEKTRSRLFPTPYNVLLIIIFIFIVYVGILNYNYIF